MKDPDLSLLPGGDALQHSLETPYGTAKLREIRYDFANDSGIVRITQAIAVDFSNIITSIDRESAAQAKQSETCNTSVSPKDFSLAPNANGDLTGGLSIATTFRACQRFHVPCHKGGLKFGMCEVNWNEDLDSHTFGVNIALKRAFYSNDDQQALREAARQSFAPEVAEIEQITDPKIKIERAAQLEDNIETKASDTICATPRFFNYTASYSDNVKLCGSSNFDERGYSMHSGVKNLLLNLIGVATFNVGSKFVLDTYRSKMSTAHASIDKAFNANLPSAAQISPGDTLSHQFLKSMKLDVSATRFAVIDSENQKYTGLKLVTQHPPGMGVRLRTFCKLARPVIAQYARYLQSTTTGDTEVKINGTDSLWSVAEKNYGSGYYYLTLLPTNEIPFEGADRLKEGTLIKVPAMYKIFRAEKERVKIGDSLWDIAGRELKDPKKYEDLARDNRRYIQSPDRIYPVQVLNLGQLSQP